MAGAIHADPIKMTYNTTTPIQIQTHELVGLVRGPPASLIKSIIRCPGVLLRAQGSYTRKSPLFSDMPLKALDEGKDKSPE